MITAHFQMMANYNTWANRRLFDAAAQVSEHDYHRDVGAFFGSLSGTLNHILVADVIWMARFRGVKGPGWGLDHVAHEDRAELAAARSAMDADIAGFVGGLTQEDLASAFTYTSIMRPVPTTQALAPALAHFFNHQTHHRGQSHGILTSLGQDAPPLDLVYFQRESAEQPTSTLSSTDIKA